MQWCRWENQCQILYLTREALARREDLIWKFSVGHQATRGAETFSISVDNIFWHPLVPLLASAVERDLAINNDRREPVAFCVLELHDLMTAASQLSPSARLLRILLNGFVLVPLNTEFGGFQMLPTCTADGCGYPAHANRSAGHQLRGDRH